MSSAIIVITHLWNTDFLHWWQYYFWGGGPVIPKNVWYERAVWGNVFALLPTAPIILATGLGVYVWHKGVVKDLEAEVERHKHHSRVLDDIVGYLDPDKDASDLHAKVEVISRSVDPNIPEGLTEMIKELRHAN